MPYKSVQYLGHVLLLWPQLHGLQHARLPCPSPTPGACANPCPSTQWCHSTISSSVVSFSSCLQSFPASGSFPVSWLFASGGWSTEASASASVLPVNIQGWFPLGLTGLSWPFQVVFSDSEMEVRACCLFITDRKRKLGSRIGKSIKLSSSANSRVTLADPIGGSEL